MTQDEQDDLKELARDPYAWGRSGKSKTLPEVKIRSTDLAGRTGLECWHDPEANPRIAGRKPHTDCRYPLCVCPCHEGGTPEEIATFVEWTKLSDTGLECWYDAATNPNIAGRKPHADCRYPPCVCPCHKGGTREEIAAFVERTRAHGPSYTARTGDGTPARDRRNLKRLIEAAGYRPAGRADNGYVLRFMGQFRDWLIFVWLRDSWLSLSVEFMKLSLAAPIKSNLIDRALDINDIISIAKVSRDQDILKLDLEYREEHVDAKVFRNLVEMLLAICEKWYPELFKIAVGDEGLQS